MRRMLVEIDEDILTQESFMLDRRLAGDIGRRDTHAPALVATEPIAHIDRLFHGFPTEIGKTCLQRLTLRFLRGEIDCAADRFIDDRTADTDIRARDDAHAVHPVVRNIVLCEQPRNAVDVQRMSAESEPADGNVLIEMTGHHAHRRIERKRSIDAVRRRTKGLNRLLAHARDRKWRIHHILITEQADRRFAL